MGPFIALFLVMLGCSTNVIFLEILTREVPGSGNLITFAQFLFIAIEGLIFTSRFLTVKPVVPLSYYLTMVIMFFVVSVANNYALNFNISMPLQMIFKSGSLIANMILGIIILKKRYKLSKYISVLLISIGITLCTIASGPKTQVSEDNSDSSSDLTWMYWLFGIFLLTFALFLSAQMGIYQEMLYTKFGKHPREALFYSELKTYNIAIGTFVIQWLLSPMITLMHALPLPAFLMFGKDIYTQSFVFSSSDPLFIPILGAFPKLWIYLLFNVITQYVCIRSVFVLTTEFSSLTVTVVLTLRKFMSLLFSIFYFQNAFTHVHWIGTTLVFVGTILFTEILSLRKQQQISTKKEK